MVVATPVPTVEYRAKLGSHICDEDARIIGPEIERLSAEGKSSAPSIVYEAEDNESPLHSYFEWDNSAAGRKYREYQARTLVRSITVTVVNKEGEKLNTASAFVAISPDTIRSDSEATGTKPPRSLNGYKQYVPVMIARESPDMTREVLAEARREFVGRSRKYEGYRELFQAEDKPLLTVMEAIDQLKEDEEEE